MGLTAAQTADHLLPYLFASFRESPTGDLDPLHSSINLRIKYGTEKRFKKMFRLSRKVFNTILEVLSPFLNDGMSRNHQQNVSASLKLGVALYCFAHGGDSFHLEAASGLSRPTALKYVHQVAELICTKLGPHWMGPALLEQGARTFEEGYMESNSERFRLRNGMPYIGAAVPYFPNSGESQQDYKNYKMWCSMLCIGIVDSQYFLIWTSAGLHDKTCTEYSLGRGESHVSVH